MVELPTGGDELVAEAFPAAARLRVLPPPVLAGVTGTDLTRRGIVRGDLRLLIHPDRRRFGGSVEVHKRGVGPRIVEAGLLELLAERVQGIEFIDRERAEGRVQTQRLDDSARIGQQLEDATRPTLTG